MSEEDVEPPKKKLKQGQLLFSKKSDRDSLQSLKSINTSDNLNRKSEDEIIQLIVDDDILEKENVNTQTPVNIIGENVDLDFKDGAGKKRNEKISINNLKSKINSAFINESGEGKELTVEATGSPNKDCRISGETSSESAKDIDEGGDSVSVLSSDQDEVNTTVNSSINTSLSGVETPGDDGNEVKKKRKLSEKQLLLRKESLRKKQELEKLRLEKKKAKESLKEERKKQKAEEDEHRKQLKEERKKQKLLEIKQKSEEKKKKDMERMQKEQEKLKRIEEKKQIKEEERRKKDEAKMLEKRKEEQAKMAFVSFFKKPKNESGDDDQTLEDQAAKGEQMELLTFMPFPVKSDMKLAVVCRRVLEPSEKEMLDKYLEENPLSTDKLYISTLKSGDHKPFSSEATWPVSNWNDDVIIIESMGDNENCIEYKSKQNVYKGKLLQFCENRRPAYWGTWRKKSERIKPRKPWGRDSKWFDYEVNSDSEWEDEEDGESLDDLDKDKEESGGEEEEGGQNEGENGYILDKQFVPHGYLSDEEAVDDEDLTPEAQKLRLTVLKEEFDEEMKERSERLKPRMLGCVWISNRTSEVTKGIMFETLLHHRCVWDEANGSINLIGELMEDNQLSTPVPLKFLSPPAADEALVCLVHGYKSSLPNLVTEFLDKMSKEFPKVSLTKKNIVKRIKQISTKIRNAEGKFVWSIKTELCPQFNVKSILVSSNTDYPQDDEKIESKPPVSIRSKKRISLISL